MKGSVSIGGMEKVAILSSILGLALTKGRRDRERIELALLNLGQHPAMGELKIGG